MGMFDDLKCEYPLPDEEVQGEWFQTKSLHCNLDGYVISKDGYLEKLQPISFTGVIRFHSIHDGRWYEYVAVFVDGRLQELKPADKHKKTLAQLQKMSGSPIEVETKRIVYDDL